MADTEHIRSSPAKSVDSRVLPSFYAGIVAELEPIYRDIDEFFLRQHDRLKLKTNETLKEDALNHTVDIYVRREISNTSFVEVLAALLSCVASASIPYVSERTFITDYLCSTRCTTLSPIVYLQSSEIRLLRDVNQMVVR